VSPVGGPACEPRILAERPHCSSNAGSRVGTATFFSVTYTGNPPRYSG